MRTESVEIYSDASNAAVLRHPDRRFPGCLVQGDSLYSLVQSLEFVQREADSLSEDAASSLAYATERLSGLLEHYKTVLTAHGIKLPFNAPPRT